MELQFRRSLSSYSISSIPHRTTLTDVKLVRLMIFNYAAFLYILEEVSISEYNPTHFRGTFHEVEVVILDFLLFSIKTFSS